MNRRAFLGGVAGTAALTILPTQAIGAEDVAMAEITATFAYTKDQERMGRRYLGSISRSGTQVLGFYEGEDPYFSLFKIDMVRNGVCQRQVEVRFERGLHHDVVEELTALFAVAEEAVHSTTYRHTQYNVPSIVPYHYDVSPDVVYA